MKNLKVMAHIHSLNGEMREIKITMKEIEELLRTDKIFTTLNGHRWIINYDELEREILKLKHTFIR